MTHQIYATAIRFMATMAISFLVITPLFATAQADEIILTIDGITGPEQQPAHVKYTGNDLAEIGQHVVTTSTDWTDGVNQFKGPLLREVLGELPASKTMVRAVAINDYAVDIPLSDFEQYDVILATSMNGEELSRRDKGPIWIVYPRDQHPELQNAKFNDRWIWQLKQLIVK